MSSVPIPKTGLRLAKRNSYTGPEKRELAPPVTDAPRSETEAGAPLSDGTADRQSDRRTRRSPPYVHVHTSYITINRSRKREGGWENKT